jgi:hypothetical protein
MTEKLYNYSYSSIYNFRPDELYGMGKESITIQGKGTIQKFLELLQHNSSLKHEDCKEFIVGTEETVEHKDWKDWIGQPMFYIVDIKLEKE